MSSEISLAEFLNVSLTSLLAIFLRHGIKKTQDVAEAAVEAASSVTPAPKKKVIKKKVQEAQMAGLTTTQTFSDGDTVTAAKLNNIVANCTIDDEGIAPGKLADNSVVKDNMANNSVDTDELVNDSVENSKLNNMAAKTVKANATNASANPTDVPVAANKLLVGTSNSINAVSFADDLALDNADSTATKIIAAPSLINGKSTVAASNLDELLLYDQDATSVLKKTTAGSIVASLKATDSQSGSAELATSAELIGGTASPTNLVAGAAVGSPMLAKAWCNFTTNVASYDTAWSSVTGATQTVVTSATFNIAAGIHTKDGTTAVGGIKQTDLGTFRVTFSTALPNTNYIVIGNGYIAGSGQDDDASAIGTVTKNVAYFDFTTAWRHDYYPNVAYFQLVVFGLGS